MSTFDLVWPYAYGGPIARGWIKCVPDDFLVEEVLGFTPDGEGEHILLHIEKRGENTDYVARQLARYAGLSPHAVSYAGMKDRHGRTRQWFSVHLPGTRTIDWSGFNSDTVSILAAVRHRRKLRRGTLEANRFTLTVRAVTGERALLERRLGQIHSAGVPNYYGSQRFGHAGHNLHQAVALLNGASAPKDRHRAGIYLSAARSFLFNQVLARRVREGTWNRAIAGDVFMFAHSASFFRDAVTPQIEQRVQQHDIHPSGPLWGKTASPASETALAQEEAVARAYPQLCEGLVRFGLETARRPLRLSVPDLAWAFLDDGALRLHFTLPAGAYATAVLREVIDCEQETNDG